MAKKVFSIHARTKDAMKNGLKTDRGVFDFGGKTVVNTSNASLAKELQDKYGSRQGGDVIVSHDEQLSKALDSGSWDIKNGSSGVSVKTLHNYTFGASNGAYSENYERIFRKVERSRMEKVQDFLLRHRLASLAWVWNAELDGKWEFGVRLFGWLEFKRSYNGPKSILRSLED
jgi:hypothetical protein